MLFVCQPQHRLNVLLKSALSLVHMCHNELLKVVTGDTSTSTQSKANSESNAGDAAGGTPVTSPGPTASALDSSPPAGPNSSSQATPPRLTINKVLSRWREMLLYGADFTPWLFAQVFASIHLRRQIHDFLKKHWQNVQNNASMHLRNLKAKLKVVSQAHQVCHSV